MLNAIGDLLFTKGYKLQILKYTSTSHDGDGDYITIMRRLLKSNSLHLETFRVLITPLIGAGSCKKKLLHEITEAQVHPQNAWATAVLLCVTGIFGCPYMSPNNCMAPTPRLPPSNMPSSLREMQLEVHVQAPLGRSDRMVSRLPPQVLGLNPVAGNIFLFVYVFSCYLVFL